MAFAAPLAAFAAHQENEEAFPLIFRLGMIPLFLFSGVFFPISQLPAGLRVIAYLSPLWHGVDLCRRLTLGQVTPGPAAIHVAYLVGLTAAGVLAATRTFTVPVAHVSSRALALRVVPPAAFGLGRGRRVIERDLLVARRTWWIPLSGIAEPVFYLLSIGIGIGKLVGGIPGPDGTTIPYATYVAPALLAASAMNGAVYESTFNVYFKLQVRQDLRCHPGHAGGSDRGGPGRDHLRPAARARSTRPSSS